MVKACITDLVGDERAGTEQFPVDIDCSIIQCVLQEAIYERLRNAPTNSITMKDIEDTVCHVLRLPPMPCVSIDFTFKR